ncbi:MAG: SpoIIE family protein phosphatase [Victivallaceae bacterium]|nr:SpoIIE family protein phosphatase [Victivallaceae bacterium]
MTGAAADAPRRAAASPDVFIDTGCSLDCRYGERACGDAVSFRRIREEQRLLCVLTDGLGHGVKADILALMTMTMALKFMAADREIVHFSEVIMDALPVCRVRHISYATFSIVDCRADGRTSLVEMGNPPFILMRGAEPLNPEGTETVSPKYRDRTMTHYDFSTRIGDRVIVFSDGVTQAGLGSPGLPSGWGRDGVVKYVRSLLELSPDISSQELSERILREAVAHEPMLRPADDISAACLLFRRPRRMLVFTGPPIDPARDAECARYFDEFKGVKIICGGTSGEIVARELRRNLTIEPGSVGGDLPPVAVMEGADLVTEGIFTLNRTAVYLEKGAEGKNDAAGRVADLMRRNDVIEFLVGTKINQAHQDPNLPAELELRRNLIGRIGNLLRDRYMKEVSIRFI